MGEASLSDEKIPQDLHVRKMKNYRKTENLSASTRKERKIFAIPIIIRCSLCGLTRKVVGKGTTSEKALQSILELKASPFMPLGMNILKIGKLFPFTSGTFVAASR